jgi:hypothetical protein
MVVRGGNQGVGPGPTGCFISAFSDVLRSGAALRMSQYMRLQKVRLYFRFGIKRILYVNACIALFCLVSSEMCVKLGLHFEPALMLVLQIGTVPY